MNTDNKHKFERDTYWRARNGEKLRIICVDIPGETPVLSCSEKGYVSHHYASGHIHPYSLDDYDLIEPWTDPLPAYDRSWLPKWARKAVARDADGVTYYFAGKPEYASDGRWLDGGWFGIIPKHCAPNWGNLPPEKCLIVWED